MATTFSSSCCKGLQFHFNLGSRPIFNFYTAIQRLNVSTKIVLSSIVTSDSASEHNHFFSPYSEYTGQNPHAGGKKVQFKYF